MQPEQKHSVYTFLVVNLTLIYYNENVRSSIVIMYNDPTGMDGEVTGEGTKENPYVIHANYYYKTGSLNSNEKEGLNGAIKEYNNNGKARKIDGQYVTFNLSAQEVDDVDEAMANDKFAKDDMGRNVSRGNKVGTNPNTSGSGDEYGSANGLSVDINRTKISDGIKQGFNEHNLIESVFIHEIGHNLGLDHSDKTNIMQQIQMTTFYPLIGPPNTIFSLPSIDSKGIRTMKGRFDAPRVDGLGVIWHRR